jgi:hypothetical protein
MRTSLEMGHLLRTLMDLATREGRPTITDMIKVSQSSQMEMIVQNDRT